MHVSVTARHIRISTTLKKYAEDRALRLERFFDPLRKVEVILETQGDHRFRAEMKILAAGGKLLVCHSVNMTGMAAVDGAGSKMERQLRRLKEKIRDRHGRLHRRIGNPSLLMHRRTVSNTLGP